MILNKVSTEEKYPHDLISWPSATRKCLSRPSFYRRFLDRILLASIGLDFTTSLGHRTFKAGRPVSRQFPPNSIKILLRGCG